MCQPYGENKYENIGEEYKAGNLEAPSKKKMEILRDLVQQIGIDCQIGG